MASSTMGSNWAIRVFADQTRGHKCKQNASTIFTCHMALHTCLSSCSDRSTYAPNESRLFWSQEKTLIHEFEPHAGIKMAQILRSPLYICVCGGSLKTNSCSSEFFWKSVSYRHKLQTFIYFFPKISTLKMFQGTMFHFKLEQIITQTLRNI